MTAVIYARYSSDNQREESIEGQVRECTAYAERHGMKVLTAYVDRALSAKTDNRPEFQRMIKESGQGLFDVILVWKLDRFARNRYDSAHYKALLRKNGVKVVSAMESIAEDSTGILLESLLEGYAEFYSAELSEKVRRGHHENALKCVSNGGAITYGYKINDERKYEIEPVTASIVKEIFTRYSEGESTTEIADSLKKRHLDTSTQFSRNFFTRLLRNRRYIGEYRYDDVVIENGIPAIIDKDLFERVQRRIDKNKHAPARTKTTADELFLLTTKIFCGDCGQSMAGESGTSCTGNTYYYYKCKSAKRKQGCTRKAIKKQYLEDVVVKHTIDILFDDRLLEYIADQAAALSESENTAIQQLRLQLAETETSINNILNAMQQGIFTKSTKQRLDELEETKSYLETRILQEQIENPIITKEQILCWLQAFRTYDMTTPKHRRQLIDYFVNSVYVYENEMTINFNYRENSETICFDKIKSSDLKAGSSPNRKGTPMGCLFCLLSLWGEKRG